MFSATINKIEQTIFMDTGSPNTIVTKSLAVQLGLKATKSSMGKIQLSGETIDVVPVVLPELKLGTMRLENVKVYAGLGNNWKNAIILGLNVLNQLIYTVDRTKGSGFIDIQLGNKESAIFNRLISADGKQYITDLPENGR